MNWLVEIYGRNPARFELIAGSFFLACCLLCAFSGFVFSTAIWGYGAVRAFYQWRRHA